MAAETPDKGGLLCVAYVVVFHMLLEYVISFCISTAFPHGQAWTIVVAYYLNFPSIVSLYITVKFTLQAIASSVTHLIQHCLKYSSPVHPSS